MANSTSERTKAIAEIRAQLAEMTRKIEREELRQRASNWAAVGSLNYVAAQLRELNTFWRAR